ncbi:phage portal protein [Halanaerobium salsuginis]|uniref:Phage portal protein, HK97 family n=1 Tax=Halanaerobium salsuginis TaxID=29563 RepID=A0A1I4LSH9_9FIRM|nr:phage portal protein [Halanaerobium salsuginis]SFL93992.1 phage portal protein, HK97 family [Halanaerobium salsuginis]
MSFLSKIKENKASPPNGDSSSLSNPAQWLIDMFNPNSTSGQNVTEESAMNHTGVYSAVRVIAETIASLPLNVYENLPSGGKRKATNNYLYSILHSKPNKLMTSFTFRETMMAHLLLWGNHYSQLELGNDGKIKGIWPLLPGQMQVKRQNDRLYYIYTKEGGGQVTFDQSEILHISGLGFDGLVGKSVIKMAREAIGLGLSAEEFGARFFSQGAQPGGIIEYPEKMSDEAYERYKRDVNKKHTGLGNSHKIMVLEEGLKYHQTGIAPDDAQFLQTRKFQIEEIARIFRLPPHMLADLDNASFSNIEQQSIDFVVNTIRPWLVRIEQVLNDKLISSRNNKNYIKFVVEGLLRGDSESRGNFYKTMFNIGAMTINDIREKEDINPLPNGDESFVPLNMVPLSEINQLTEGEESKNIKNNFREIRAKRNAAKRTNIRKRFKPLFKKSAEKIISSENEKIKEILKDELKNKKRNRQNFRDKIVEYYDNKLPEEIKKEMAAVINSLADAVAEEAAKEVNLDSYDIKDFLDNYIRNMSKSYAGYSRGQLLSLMDENETVEEAIKAIEKRLNEWEEKRANKLSEKQANKVEGAVSRKIFIAAGSQELIWIANSGACPICKELDGKVIGIKESFVSPEETLLPDEKNFSPSTVITHNPLHDECECSISSY